MTPEEFKRARTILRLSAKGMAHAVGLSQGRNIRMYEASPKAKNRRRIPEPVARLVRAMLHGYDPLTDTMRHKRAYLGEKPKPRKKRAVLQWAWDVDRTGGLAVKGGDAPAEPTPDVGAKRKGPLQGSD